MPSKVIRLYLTEDERAVFEGAADKHPKGRSGLLSSIVTEAVTSIFSRPDLKPAHFKMEYDWRGIIPLGSVPLEVKMKLSQIIMARFKFVADAFGESYDLCASNFTRALLHMSVVLVNRLSNADLAKRLEVIDELSEGPERERAIEELERDAGESYDAIWARSYGHGDRPWWVGTVPKTSERRPT